MFTSKDKKNSVAALTKSYFKNKSFQRVIAGVITIVIAFFIIQSGATPERYNLKVGEISKYNITAGRDIEDRIKTVKNAELASEAVPSVMREIKGASIEIRNRAGEFIKIVENARGSVEESLQDQGITRRTRNYEEFLERERNVAAADLNKKVKEFGLKLSFEQVSNLIRVNKSDINKFKEAVEAVVTDIVTQDITNDNLAEKILEAQNELESIELSQNLKNIGEILLKEILEPNKTIDYELTKAQKQDAYNDVLENKKVIIKKNERLISVNEVITTEKYDILKELNLLEESNFDFALAAGVLIILLLLAFLLVLYMNHFCKKILYNRSELILLFVIIILTLAIARGVYSFTNGVYEHSALAIPSLIAVILISILLDLKLAIIVNVILTVAIALMTKGQLDFLYMALISGTLAAFIIAKANQRNRLFMSGIFIALFNVLIITAIGIINKYSYSTVLTDIAIVSINGVLTIVLALGTLPFWESVFNVITPLKLLELANPNQPLVKRLLMEAPGTYHHSLMVGNLAEVATEAIGGNALLARVGAYFHDIGKLKRPGFFKENQLSENPHDRMTANLSTLVITSHTHDGVDLAKKYKIPLAVREIISQHHGTTLVAYFFHKAKKNEKGEEVKQENFRYEGPKPASKEAAVVMLADSVEAAVRSMIDKTEGKIEGLVRKIIKDKLDDGQLDLCSLTLKDLDDVAKSFMKVLSGFFHEREEYPEVKLRTVANEPAKSEASEDSEGEKDRTQQEENGRVLNGNNNREPAGKA
ncbi:MAG: HDIG domain-containing protein [Clostridia bacterium]|nr:HDIG domain-containing protein [Clostridia bacterium]